MVKITTNAIKRCEIRGSLLRHPRLEKSMPGSGGSAGIRPYDIVLNVSKQAAVISRGYLVVWVAWCSPEIVPGSVVSHGRSQLSMQSKCLIS